MSDSFAIPRSVACQAPLSMGFSRQEHWSGLPFPSPGNLPTQGSTPGLWHCRQMLLPSEPPGKSYIHKTKTSLSLLGLGAGWVSRRAWMTGLCVRTTHTEELQHTRARLAYTHPRFSHATTSVSLLVHALSL